MNVEVKKLAIYKFSPVCFRETAVIGNVVSALEGEEANTYWAEDGAVAIVDLIYRGKVDSYSELIADRINTLQKTLNELGDNEMCSISLAYATSLKEVYVCWNHRKVWIINTEVVGSRLGDTPKSCRECHELVEKSKMWVVKKLMDEEEG